MSNYCRLSVTRTSPIRVESGSSMTGPSSSVVPTSTPSPDSPRTSLSSTWSSQLRAYTAGRANLIITDACSSCPRSRSPTKNFNYQTDTKLSSSAWHSDVTYEKQPPGLTGLWLYDSPPSGGDTGAYDDAGSCSNRPLC